MCKNKKAKCLKKGFTLVEVLVVVVIIGVLAAISYPIFSKAILKARATEAVNLLETVKKKQVNYYANKAAQSEGAYMTMEQLNKSPITNSSQSLDGDSLKVNEKYYLSSAGNGAQVAYKKTSSSSPLFTLSLCYDKAGLACTGEICKSFGDTVVDSLECGGGCEGPDCGTYSCEPDSPRPTCETGCKNNYYWSTLSCSWAGSCDCSEPEPVTDCNSGDTRRGTNGCKDTCDSTGHWQNSQTPMSSEEEWNPTEGRCTTKEKPKAACPDGTIILRTINGVHQCKKFENGEEKDWVDGESC